jgi:Uma2 family endonuclease
MSTYASLVASRIVLRLGSHADKHGLGTVIGEGVFILDAARDLRRRPDVAFVTAAKWPLDRPVPETGDWQMVPDLAVEVVSPNDVLQEVFTKMREYFRYGARQVWIVLPIDREVYVYDSPTSPHVLTAADDLDGGSLLPGLRLPLGTLFQPQPQAPSVPPVTP